MTTTTPNILDEIERLTRERDRLRTAIETISDRAECRCATPVCNGCSPEIYAIAKAALEATQ